MFAPHRQNRSRLLLVTAIFSGLLWSSVGTPRSALAQDPDPAAELYVSSVKVHWFATTGGRASRETYANVDIVDGNGTPINGALVIGNWSGCFNMNNASDTTETVCYTSDDGTTTCVDGRAVIWGRKTNCPKKNCYFTFTVTDVQKDGMTYVPVDGKTSDSVPCNPVSAQASRGPKATWASSRRVVTPTQPIPSRRFARWWRR